VTRHIGDLSEEWFSGSNTQTKVFFSIQASRRIVYANISCILSPLSIPPSLHITRYNQVSSNLDTAAISPVPTTHVTKVIAQYLSIQIL